jgi:RHS repeat-associated protein
MNGKRTGPPQAGTYSARGVDEILLRADYVSADNGAGQGFFYQQNRLGSVTHLLGFQGERIEEYRYDAPVTTYHANGIFDNRFKFTGREYQAAFGIYEYRNRAYHPGLGRFLSEDPMGFAAGDSNLFRYCGADPVNGSDPIWTQGSQSEPRSLCAHKERRK